jgi:histidinol-phosphatase (PHP family)
MSSHERQARDLPLDAHLHTELSHDSAVVIDAYAQRAVDNGIAELAITDHVDFAPSAPGFGATTFQQRERYVREAAERWADAGLAIRFGAEITWDSAWEDAIREHLGAHAYDFVIGSVHVYRDSPYAPGNVAAFVNGRSLPDIVGPYFAEVAAGARTGLFDVMGHIDFVKRFLAPHLDLTGLRSALELYEPILHALIDTGTGLELNTSGLRSPAEETFPSAPVVARFRDLGGRGLTIGSDAHDVDHVAWAFDDGYATARRSGFSELTFRRGGSERVAIELPRAPNATAASSL